MQPEDAGARVGLCRANPTIFGKASVTCILPSTYARGGLLDLQWALLMIWSL